MEHCENQNIMLTIEGQLEHYSRCENSTERHKCLWHAWNHNKRWLVQLLEWVMQSFPTYSKHDVSHATSVLHNIELLMGENCIKKLSASDCFLILHTVYIHDIGMCITSEYRRNLMNNPDFVNFLNECSYDPILKKYSDLLLGKCREEREESMDTGDREFDKHKLLQRNLEIYYAITYLVAEYRRYNHGQESQKILSEWVMDHNKLGAGFSTSGIPSRFFYTIGACAGVHTSYDFNDIMALPKQDGGYVRDYMHPRFAAVLLQLGDALDLDNDRFHPLMEEFNYNIPTASKLHLGKHRAIRRLRISPSKITIHASCEKNDELRLVQREYEGIKDILKNATFNWSAICPENMEMLLPELEDLVLTLNGSSISSELVTIEFKIQQSKAFNLLQGSNIYRNERFVFLREVFQNAIDATKLEYWKDWQGSRWKKDGETDCERFLDPNSYPIEVEFHLAVREKYSKDYRIIDTLDEYNEYKKSIDPKIKIESPEFGVAVKVIDYGTGITKKDVLEIANVGSRYKLDAGIYANMPGWLKPTAEFGLGLQSIFLVSNYFKAYTRVRNGECYDIEFNGTGGKGDGSVNVIPVNDPNELARRAYGTCFEIFVSSENKEWNVTEFLSKTDPFMQDSQEESARLDRARALSVQMVLYLDEIIGEKLFPVKIKLFDYCFEHEMPSLIIKEKANNLYIELNGNGKSEPLVNQEKKEEVTWTYCKKNECSTFQSVDECKYLFDFENGCLKVADAKNELYACFCAERIIKMHRFFRDSEIQQKHVKTQIYYKGVYVTEYDLELDLDMLEYIDIKGSLNREYMAVNRAEFTEAGKRYISEQLYPKILSNIQKAINDYTDGEQWKELMTQLNEKTMFENEKDSYYNLRKYLFIVGIVAFMHSRSYNTYLLYAEDTKQKERNKKWNEILEALSRYITEEMNENRSKKDHWTRSIFCQISVYEIMDDEERTLKSFRKQNLADILRTGEKYAVISTRKESSSLWNEVLVHLTEDNTKNIKQSIMNLKIQSDPDEQKNLTNWIEKSLDNIARSARNIDNILAEVNQDSYVKEHEVILWMLDNLPSVAIYSNSDNTIRINVLDCEQTDSVYISRCLKMAIYQRMAEISREDEGKQRFSTVSSTTFCQLGMEQDYPGVYFLKRGKFGKVGYRRIIFPITGKTLNELKDWLENSLLSRLFVLYEKIYEYCTMITKVTYEKMGKSVLKPSELPKWMDTQEKKRIERIIEKRKKHIDENGEMSLLEYPILCDEIAGRLNQLLEAAKQEKIQDKQDIEDEISCMESLLGVEPREKRAKDEEEEQIDIKIIGIICEKLLCSEEDNPCLSDEEEKTYQMKQAALIKSWDIMKNDLPVLRNYIRKGNCCWDTEIGDCLVNYFAYIEEETSNPGRSSLPEEKRKLETRKEEALRTKKKLIETVVQKNWVRSLDYNQVEILYFQLIRDIMDTLLISLGERKEFINRSFHITSE